MPETQRREPIQGMEEHKHTALSAAIGRQVIHTLGRPGGLLTVQVHRLWENTYRVNVFIGDDAVSARIGKSYFVEADNQGNITKSTPKITMEY